MNRYDTINTRKLNERLDKGTQGVPGTMSFKGILYTISFNIDAGFFYTIHGKTVRAKGNFASFDAAQTAAHKVICSTAK